MLCKNDLRSVVICTFQLVENVVTSSKEVGRVWHEGGEEPGGS